MEVVVAVQNDTLLRSALRVQLKNKFPPAEEGPSTKSLRRSGDPEEESPIPEQLCDPICVQSSA